MNKILYKLKDGKPSFWLMRYVPEDPGYCSDHAVCDDGCPCDQINYSYKEKLEQCKANALEIINAEIINPYDLTKLPEKDGDIFPFPDSLEFEEEEIDTVEDSGGCYVAGSRTVIRLIPKQKEESQYELWRELYSELYFGEKFFSFLNRNKSKFTISRKP